MSFYAIVLTTNEGNMNSTIPAPMQTAGGRTLIDHILSAAGKAGAERRIVVSADAISSVFSDIEYAASAADAAELLKSADGTALFMYSDAPLITAESLKNAYDEHIKYGRAATAVSADIYFFDIKKYTESQAESPDEAYKILSEKNEITGKCDISAEETLKVVNMIDLARADAVINRREAERLMLSGVRILNPESVRIGCDVSVGCNTVIYPNTILEGNTKIGKNCIIGPNSRICDCKIGDGTEVQSSVATESEIGDNTSVGPFAYIRPNSKIGNNIKVGDFVEVKNATIGNNTKLAHLTYVGDADVGERVNFGCGTVVVNYDGAHKHRTTIGDDCFIGCNTNLVSPVKINNGAYTAAGSTITDEVPENALAIARARQVNKTGWKRPKK